MITWRGTLAKAIAKEKGKQHLRKIADEILEESQELVPKASRALQASGAIQEVGGSIFITYDTPYAVRQHEDTTLRHPDPTNPVSAPGCAHYLLIPFLKGKSKIGQTSGWF
jgi:hypothetical protein